MTRVDDVPSLGDTPPESWGDFVTDLTAIAHEVAAEVGRTAQVSDIRVGTAAEDYANHTGSWLWGGKIVLGEEVPDGIEMIARARAEGRPLTSHEAGEVWLSYATGIHEMLHAAHGISAYDYQQPALMGMEEALNEEYSRIVTAKALKRLNIPEALQFQRDRPDSIRGRGAYLYYRSALDDILNKAKVAPEEREEFIRHLRFDVPPSQRAALIGERIAKVAPEETDGPEQAALWVDGVIEHAGQVKSPLGFEPILHVPLKDVPHTEPYLIDGKPFKPNMGVEVMVDGHPFTGRVASIYPLDQRGEAVGAPFLFSMVTDQFEHIDNILPREVTDLDSVEESVTLPDGSGVKEGDLIRYDNRADGGMSTAVVEQVTQSSQRGPMPGLLKDAWVLHARTTQDSLVPDQEIVLTLARTGGRVERVDTEGPEIPEAAPEGAGAGFVSRLPELERELAEERARVAAPLSSFERRTQLANEIKAERARMDADTEALRKGDRVLIKGYLPEEPDKEGTVVKTNKASIDVAIVNSVGNPVVWRFEKASRNADGTWYAAIGRPIKKGPARTEGIVDSVSIPRGLFDELWMLEYDTAPGEGTDHDDLADELARVRDATPRTARNLTVELTPRRARYLDQALDYHDTIWEEATQSYDAGDRARANSYRRTARRLRERLAGVKTEGIIDPAAELRSMQEGTHPRVFFGLEDRATTGGRGEEAGSQPAWTDADKLQVGRQISDALEDYALLIEKPEFHRVLRWSGDESYARTLQNGWHEPTRPRRANIYLRLDNEERFDGWGVTDTGSSTARVDIRRPGVNYIDNPRENVLGVAADDARYTAIHEAHHMYGSGSEFDFGSEVAHAWHGLQRGLADEQMLTSRRAVTNRVAVNRNSRLSRSLRALFGDDLLDEWGQEAGWHDLFDRRRVPPEDNSIEGRVATLNEYRDEYGYSVLQQIDYLERKNLVDVSGLTSYGSRIEPGERAYMRPNGETLVLGVDGQARVLESMSAVRPVETRGVDVTQHRVLPFGGVDDQPPEVDMADELAGLAGPTGPRKWTRIEDGYESDNARIWDNGAGLGPAAGGGRWAVEIEGRWIANVDTLAQAKERVEAELAKPPVVRSEGIEPPTPIHVQAWNLRQELDGATWRRNNLEDSDPQRAEADAEVERLSNEVAAAEAQTGGRVLRLNDEQMHRGEIKMRDLAKRAKKLGLDEPRLRVVAEEMVPVPWPGLTSRWSREEWEKRGDVTPITYVVAEGPEPKLNGWEFVATLQHLEGINVIRRVPGTEEDVDLSQHRAGEATCDYCKTVRDRKDTFIVHQVDTDAAHAELADDKGNVQVGRNCLRDFLGHGNPQEIASYLERWMNLDELEEEGEGPSGGRVKEYMPVEDYLMHVATMLRTSGWASRSSGELATADQARMNRQAYNSQERDKSGRQMWVDPIPQDEERAKAAIAWAREYLGAKVHQSQDASEFESNMYAMAKGEHVPDRGEGILAYVMVAHAKFEEREIERRERAKVEADSVHVGTVGERMDVEATVMSVYEHEGNYGTTFITKLRDDQGNIYKWFGSYELERGSVVRAKWTVKDHSEYKGVKETVLNRPSKLETVRTEGGEEGLPEGWVPTPVSEVRAGDNLLVLPTDRRGTAHRLATPDENALDGVGTEVVEREARLVAWTFTGEELELPAEGEVVRRVPEVRTEGVGGVPSASSISRVLAQAGYRALGSGTPRSREGTRVSGGRDHVSVWVDFDNEAAAARRSEELEQVLAEKGYATRRAAPAGFWVTGRVEGARTEGVEPPGDPTRLVSKGADPQWGTPVYETGDGRGRIVLDPTYETWCDDPHPMKFTREERDAWKALSSFEREQRRRNMPYEKYRALDYGKKGYLCPGGEEHHYSQWVPEIEGERLEDVHDTFGKAKAALEAALGYKLTLQRQRKPKPEPVVLSPEDEEFKASLDDELAALDDSLASFRERLKGPDADFVDTEQLGRLERRREQVLALLDGLGAGAARTEGIVSPTGPFFHGTNVPLQPGDRLTARPEDRAPNYAAPGVEGWAYMSTGDHMAERFAVSVAGRQGGEPHLYEVRPVGEVVPDPEQATGWSQDQWMAREMEVVRELPLPGLVTWNPETQSLVRAPRTEGVGPDMFDALGQTLGMNRVEDSQLGGWRSVRFASGEEEQVWLLSREDGQAIRVSHVVVTPERGGTGSRLVEGLRAHADETGQELRFELVVPESRPFFDRFEWLQRIQPEGRESVDYTYRPPGYVPERGPRTEGVADDLGEYEIEIESNTGDRVTVTDIGAAATAARTLWDEATDRAVRGGFPGRTTINFYVGGRLVRTVNDRRELEEPVRTEGLLPEPRSVLYADLHKRGVNYPAETADRIIPYGDRFFLERIKVKRARVKFGHVTSLTAEGTMNYPDEGKRVEVEIRYTAPIGKPGRPGKTKTEVTATGFTEEPGVRTDGVTGPRVPLADSQNGGYIWKPASYLRFGDLPTDEEGRVRPSDDWLAGKPEAGVSVYHAWHDPRTGRYVLPSGDEQYLGTQAEMGDRPAIRVEGRDTGEVGSDGEPLLDPSTVEVVGPVTLDQIVTEQDSNLTLAGTELEGDQVPDWHEPEHMPPVPRTEGIDGPPVRTEGVPDPIKEAGFYSEDEAREELAKLAEFPQYLDTSDDDLLSAQRRFSQRLHGNTLTEVEGLRARARRGELSDTEIEMHEQVERSYAAVNAHVGARMASARAARERQARQEAAEKGLLTLGREELAEILGKAGDVYHDLGYEGEYNPDLFLTSDLSGRGIRHYIRLPDGRLAHPDELHEARKRGRVVVVEQVPAPRDRPRYRSDALDAETKARLVGPVRTGGPRRGSGSA